MYKSVEEAGDCLNFVSPNRPKMYESVEEAGEDLFEQS